MVWSNPAELPDQGHTAGDHDHGDDHVAEDPLVDPVISLRNKDGVEISDDLVNYHGGKPGRFLGVELDGRFQWRFREHFAFDLEGALLFPGNALHDEHGQATRSVLVQGRTTFWF